MVLLGIEAYVIHDEINDRKVNKSIPVLRGFFHVLCFFINCGLFLEICPDRRV